MKSIKVYSLFSIILLISVVGRLFFSADRAVSSFKNYSQKVVVESKSYEHDTYSVKSETTFFSDLLSLEKRETENDSFSKKIFDLNSSFDFLFKDVSLINLFQYNTFLSNSFSLGKLKFLLFCNIRI
jgi:hypothetical protein